ncbi:helix-turn-helix domain-containing protein [Cytobacillus oceanisediminis]|uniref:helix-turn-helix domain-containing protein n=1 Tax=Cytobacillus oceanisediminis TaxID=665099 RepID=UPI00207AF51C|nr:helix-turn-helix domain-containing protein [Cytobacillus oceanisediminis]USK45810.1 helix-turn-helix transcriptional regulator [Cytobacillus oceanisediminis]
MNDKKVIVRWELSQYLARNGITQKSFGEMCTPPMDKHQVNRLTRAKAISFERLEQLMNALNLPPDELGEIIKVYKVKK